ncbi:hypothetical protein I317_00335 [Kwoniella heveanensis CBS 569]|nr:hypothetical protein I317_00335 [Kwoniella heveanensis CBS 569]
MSAQIPSELKDLLDLISEGSDDLRVLVDSDEVYLPVEPGTFAQWCVICDRAARHYRENGQQDQVGIVSAFWRVLIESSLQISVPRFDFNLVREQIKAEIKAETKEEIKVEVKEEVKHELKEELKAELKDEIKDEIRAELNGE